MPWAGSRVLLRTLLRRAAAAGAGGAAAALAARQLPCAFAAEVSEGFVVPEPPQSAARWEDVEKAYLPPYAPNPDNSVVFLDIAVDDEPVGRVEIELFDDTVPRTARNFACLCTGYYKGYPVIIKGKMAQANQAHQQRQNRYKNTLFHCVRPGFHAQGGDTTKFDGTGGESIYASRFQDETWKGKAGHVLGPGILAMATCSKHGNQSQFFITYRPCPWLNRRNVVFGQVVKGWSVMKRVEQEGTAHGRPRREVSISDCGLIKAKSGALADPDDPVAAPPKVEWTGKGPATSLTKMQADSRPELMEDGWKYRHGGMHNPLWYDMRSGDGTGAHRMPPLYRLTEDLTNVGCS